MTVSPTSMHLTSVNAGVNSQIMARRFDFQKPVEDYDIVNQFGRSVLSSEGADWRRQRRIIAPAFSEKSNAYVWEQSLEQAQSLLSFWAQKPGNTVQDMKIETPQVDTGTLTLHVICGAGFGVPQLWPHEDESRLGNKRLEGFNTFELTGGHEWTFKDSLKKTVGLEIMFLWLFPHWLLSLYLRLLVGEN